MELFSPGHLIVLALIAGVLFFGWKQLPDMARSAGRSLHLFRTEMNGLSDGVKGAAAEVRETGQSIKDGTKPAPNVPPPSRMNE